MKGGKVGNRDKSQEKDEKRKRGGLVMGHGRLRKGSHAERKARKREVQEGGSQASETHICILRSSHTESVLHLDISVR